MDDTSCLALAFFSHQGHQQLHSLRMSLPVFQIKKYATDKTYKCSLRLLTQWLKLLLLVPPEKATACLMIIIELNPLWSLSPDFDDQNLEVKRSRAWW